MIDATGLTWGWLISCAVFGGAVLMARTGIARYRAAKRAEAVPHSPQPPAPLGPEPEADAYRLSAGDQIAFAAIEDGYGKTAPKETR